MARDETARDSDSLLDRRSYLKLAGAAAASVAATGAATKATAASYDTITVSAGQSRTFQVGNGETFENKLIDITADGASAHIYATSNNFTIRNVGFKGTHPGSEFPIVLSVPDESATGTVENLYLGDGAIKGSYAGGIFVQYSPAHRGTLQFKNLHVAHFSNNGLYGSAPGHRGQPGTSHVADSYFHSNNISNIRLGNDTETNTVRNCTVHVDDTTPACDANCSDPGAVVNRGIWAWTGDVHLDNCDVQGRLETYEGGQITQSATSVGSNADTTPPQSVPMSAEEAASGNATDGSSTDGSSTDGSTTDSSTPQGDRWTFQHSGTGTVTYEGTFGLPAGTNITKATDGDQPAEEADTVTVNDDGTVTISGEVGGDGARADTYYVPGACTPQSFSASDDPANWTVTSHVGDFAAANVFQTVNTVDSGTSTGDGSTSDGSTTDGSSSDNTLPNVIVVDGSEKPRSPSKYEFTVTGSIEKAGDLGSINAYDTISGNSTTGRVVNGKDAFRFSGEVTHFRLKGSAMVEVRDGSQ